MYKLVLPSKKARKQGIKEGRKESAQDIARKLLAAGFPMETIVQCTGVSAGDLTRSTTRGTTRRRTQA
jgi:hypothetical protein